MNEISDYYDDYAASQLKKGIHHRHLAILRALERHGLRSDMKVLEIGSGIGTVSELILRSLSPKGSLFASDISPASIKLLRARLAKYKNLRAEVENFTEGYLDERFDFIVLPDVIEHIPIGDHPALFHNVAAMLAPGGRVFIHIPDPNCLERDRIHRTEHLQIIDQPIHTGVLCQSLAATDLYIQYLESYSLYETPYDYQYLVLQRTPQHDSYKSRNKILHDSVFRRLIRKIKYVLRGKK